MAVKGVFASDAGIVGDRKGDFAAALLQIDPTGSAPLFALTSGMESADATDTVVTWFEENKITGRVNVVNNAGVGTSLTVDDASYTVGGEIQLVESTGEYIFVLSVAGNVLTVERGFAGTTPSAIDGTGTPVPIQRIGTAHEEGSSRPQATANLGYPRFNYMQIFRNAWDVTGTARRISWHTGDVVAKNKRDAGLFHAEDIEKSLWFSRKEIGIKNGMPFRTMDGVATQIVTNVTAQAVETSYIDIRDFLQGVFEKNIKGKPNERIAFCGNTVLATLDTIAFANSVMNIAPGQTEFGMEINKWMTPFGTITLMTHPLFNENPTWTENLYVLHPGAMRTRYLRRTSEDDYDKDGSRAGVDADFGVLTSELSCEYRAEVTGGIFTGMNNPKTDGLGGPAT